MKNLTQLLQNISIIRNTQHQKNVEVNGLCFDSRAVQEGYMFFATKGTTTDGHNYIDTAIEKGASVIVCEQMPSSTHSDIVYIQVPDSSEAMGKIASNWYDNPSEKLIVVGVTGTNGKTTIATLLYQLFEQLEYPTGLISTVCNYVHKEAFPSTHTTPDALSLQALLHQMVEAGCKYAFMEVSSHAIDQKRISGIAFDGGIFTNLTRDHLDYHQTVDAYLKAKKAFFDQLPKSAFALTNTDDRNGLVMLQNSVAAKYTYSTQSLANYKGRIIENGFEGMLLTINNKEVSVSFIGKFNASNLLAVYGTATLLGIPADDALVALSVLKPVSGRFETVQSATGFTAIVDYAHTPDALTNVLETINSIQMENPLNAEGRVITVIGCGGNRDKGKRPIMAKEAVKSSNKVILTSDNPRFENPTEILNDMLAGLTEEEKKGTLVIEDRLQAIKTACMLAKKGDIILIAGKGHETYQDIAGVKHHFDDKEIVTEIFNQL
ncbi:MAG: UDP-N-acetylmuramoyl-L-alanyl-D-glutamate--2,6-diaminopimelate ligase [Paludibacteraceae bacterium]|nr:UDP-N-acetylmuramoyl-L-alanyl-D-glutamate--2,6-diaminopimelate ligase [Paludibacteraceae bacterium]